MRQRFLLWVLAAELWTVAPTVASAAHRPAMPPRRAACRCPLPARSVGENEAQQAQLSAVTKEATAKALLITIKKLQV